MPNIFDVLEPVDSLLVSDPIASHEYQRGGRRRAVYTFS